MDKNEIHLADYMDIKEASEKLRKSDKQVRRYIHDNRLEAYLIGRQYFISRTSVQALLTQPLQIEDTMARHIRELEDKLSRHIEETSRRLEDIEQMMSSQIEQLISEMPNFIVQNKDKATRQKSTISPGGSELPPGYLSVREMNRLHGMADTTVGRKIERGTLSATRNDSGWKVGRTYVKEAFSPEQQRAYYEANHSMPGFISCERCPH